MLTKNVDISDCLINGAIGTAVKIHRRATSAKPSGVIFVQFDDPEAGSNSMSSHRQDELKDCAPNEAVTQQFSVSKNRSRNSDLKGKREREPFLLPVAHAMTVHKSQGSTIAYLTGDMDRSTKNPKIDECTF